MPFWTTLGYAAAGSDCRLAYYMSKPHTLLIDLRKGPYSDYVIWDESHLSRNWGKRYRRAGAYLGNISHADGGPISIPRLQEGLEVLLDYVLEGWSLVLLCGCMNFCECHRQVVQIHFEKLLQARSVDIPYVIEDTPEPGMMNCLSVKQPWAEIIVRAHLFQALEQRPKDVENRCWMTPWRGRLAIHAGTTFATSLFHNKVIDPMWWQDRFGTLAASLIPVHKDQYPLGAIIGVADLDAVLTPDAPRLLDNPWYVPGQYGFTLKNIQPIDPIPWRGQRRLFQIPAQLVLRQLRLCTIYVDEIREYDTSLPYKHWCHMATDGDIEHLHAFARRLALKPEWFQAKPKHPHYDLTPGKRTEAIKLGAVAVTSRELLEKCSRVLLSKERGGENDD